MGVVLRISCTIERFLLHCVGGVIVKGVAVNCIAAGCVQMHGLVSVRD